MFSPTTRSSPIRMFSLTKFSLSQLTAAALLLSSLCALPAAATKHKRTHAKTSASSSAKPTSTHTSSRTSAKASSRKSAKASKTTASKSSAKSSDSESSATTKTTATTRKGRRGKTKTVATVATVSKPRFRGQQSIDEARTTQIQQALIREHYLSGEATGQWDQATRDALIRYQGDNHWQTKILPDSRALIKLGLGPSQQNLLNPESAAINMPSRSLEKSSSGGSN